MDMQKRPVIRVLNALMACLGVAAGGLVICGLLLACVPTPTLTEGDVDAGRPAGAESSERMDADQSSEIGTSNEDQHLLEKYEEDIASGAATAETYLELAEYWMDRGDADRAERVLRQGLEDTSGDTDIGKALEELTGESVAGAASARELRRDTYDEAGDLLWSHVYQYDDQGRLSGVTAYNAAGEQNGYVDILYDTDGREIQSYGWSLTQDEQNGMVDPILYHYDTAGRMGREEYYADGELRSYLIYQYGGAAQAVRSNSYSADGVLTGYSLYEYDSSGKPVRTDFYEPDGALRHYTINTYDADGNRTNYVCYGADGSAYFGTNYTYDESGNMVQMENWDLQKKTVTYIQYE